MKKLFITLSAIAFIFIISSCGAKREGCPGIAKAPEKVRAV